jgi:hypothetical protein
MRIAEQHSGDALAGLREGQLDVLLGWQRTAYGAIVSTLVLDTVERVTMPFSPPMRHDVLLIWLPGQETPAVRAFIAHCAAGPWP